MTIANQYRFHITKVSGNRKTGPIPVTTTSRDACPDSCPLKEKGCYAAGGPSAIHWRKVTSGERSTDEGSFLRSIRAFPAGQVFRINQAGDLPHNPTTGEVDKGFLQGLTKAAKGKRGILYTHHDPDAGVNADTFKKTTEKGLTVNVSANNVAEAVRRYKEGFATVTLLPMDAPNTQEIDGVKVVACPAEKSDKVTCSNCVLCANGKRDYVIGFRAHGVSKRHVEVIARG